MNLHIESSAWQAIAGHLERDYPHEACGFLLGREEAASRRVTLCLAVPNRSAENRGRRFIIDPADYMRAERLAAGKGLDLLGVYHSHPDAPSIPSAHDLEFAQPYFSYLIVTVQNGKVTAPRSYRLSGDAFSEETLHDPLEQRPAFAQTP